MTTMAVSSFRLLFLFLLASPLGVVAQESDETKTLGEILADAPAHAMLGAALGMVPALQEQLAAEGPMTVFVPTDAALMGFVDKNGIDMAKLLQNIELLTTALLYHGVGEKVMAADITDGMKLKSLMGDELTMSVKDGKVTINGGEATVAQADIVGKNGVIHIIDNLLLAPSMKDQLCLLQEAGCSIYVMAKSSPDHTALKGLIDKVPAVVKTLTEDKGPFTIFAPTDAAVKELTAEQLKVVEDEAKLKELLLYHVLEGKVMSDDITADGVTAKTLQGTDLTVTKDGRKVFVNGDAQVSEADVAATNGVIHIIKKVLVPEGFFAAPTPEPEGADTANSAMPTTQVSILLMAGGLLSFLLLGLLGTTEM